MYTLDCLQIAYSKNYLKSHENICFEAIQNGGKSECFRLEQSSVMKFLVAEKCEPCEIHRRMYDTIYLTPPLEQDMTQGQFLSGV